LRKEEVRVKGGKVEKSVREGFEGYYSYSILKICWFFNEGSLFKNREEIILLNSTKILLSLKLRFSIIYVNFLLISVSTINFVRKKFGKKRESLCLFV